MEWDIPTMIVIADAKKRVTLPTRPGYCFDVQACGDDKFVLTRLAPVGQRPVRVTIATQAGFSIGKTGKEINLVALKEALDEFP